MLKDYEAGRPGDSPLERAEKEVPGTRLGQRQEDSGASPEAAGSRRLSIACTDHMPPRTRAVQLQSMPCSVSHRRTLGMSRKPLTNVNASSRITCSKLSFSVACVLSGFPTGAHSLPLTSHAVTGSP